MITKRSPHLWYVLHTKSRFENVVFDGLAKKSIKAFLPKIRVKSRRRDRKMTIRVPLFPGYVFVKSDLAPNEQLEIVKTVGAVRLIGSSEGPVHVPTDTIQSLKIMVSVDQTVTTGNRFTRGDPVMVISGPFAGVSGSFMRYRSKGRVVVHIEALGQYAAVEVDEDDVEILPEIMS
jgi:transcriptional antiterminator NusG